MASSRAFPHGDLTRQIIGAAFAVHNEFGFGFLETVYAKALAAELQHLGLQFARECPFELVHRGVPVGHYRADLIVASSVVVEVKTGLFMDPAYLVQLLNYLKAARIEVGLVINFGLSVEVKRLAVSDAMRGIIDSPAVTRKH